MQFTTVIQWSPPPPWSYRQWPYFRSFSTKGKCKILFTNVSSKSPCLLKSRVLTSLSHSLKKVNLLSDFVLLCSLAYVHIMYGSSFSAGDRMRVLHSKIKCHKMMHEHLRFVDNTENFRSNETESCLWIKCLIYFQVLWTMSQ